jgi:transposase
MTPPKKNSPRHRTLQQQGLVNLNAEAVKDERFHKDDFFDPADLVQVRYEMLRSVREKEQAAAAAAYAFGVSRATFYQAQAAFDREGVVGLIPHKRGPRGAHKLTEEVLVFVEEQIERDPSLGSANLTRLIGKRFKISVHSRSIERALERRKKKRLHRK